MYFTMGSCKGGGEKKKVKKKKKKENKGRLKATFAFKGARVRISSLV